MRDWFNENHPRNSGSKDKPLSQCFRCFRCKESHGVLGSRQRKSEALGKLVRYCPKCFEIINKPA